MEGGEVLARGREALWDPLLRGVSSVFFWRRRGVDAGAHGWTEVPSTKGFAPRRDDDDDGSARVMLGSREA